MNRFHVVGITTKGYHRLSSHETFDAAKDTAIKRGTVSMGLVVRDGTTGKRYCIAELMTGRCMNHPRAA